ncbi:hypothetical protein H0H92_005297 [Tricholoma furcatifolium]|nr:hypothetical protein H0H92_005297 [Tricholoma furcatifolium]
MPEDWKNTPEDKKLVIHMPSGATLKHKDVSSDQVDPDLGQGFAYFVQEAPYKAHLERHKTEVEPKSNCSRHNAVNLANAKINRGLAATGVATVECMRHDMKRPCSVGDLQVGERTFNSGLHSFVISYDITCQWSVHLRQRMSKLDRDFVIFADGVNVGFFVPKFHLTAHVVGCRTKFSLNYNVGVGRTDGEAPERGWADSNPLASSTKEMGPGSRRDALDSHFGDHNWKKIIALGRALMRKFKTATTDMVDHFVAHFQLTASLPHDVVLKWERDVKLWERDHTQFNPFETNVKTPTLASIRHQLAQAEALSAGTSQETSLDERVSPSVLISLGMEIEAEQYVSLVLLRCTKIQLRANALQRKIAAWEKMNGLYIPGVDALSRTEERSAAAQKKPIMPYTQTLWLPSKVHVKLVFDRHLAEVEWKLRVAQACEALDALRSNLQIRSHLYKFKDRFVRGQHANTRARNSIETVQARIQAATEEYRAAYVALNSLSILLSNAADLGELNVENWRLTLLPLEAGDIRELAEADNERTSEGRRVVSWIWRTLGVISDKNDSEALRDALRIEWCKSRSRAMRFSEEVELLTEEMHRVLRYLRYKEAWWQSKAAYALNDGFIPICREGLVAYASRQASLSAELHTSFSHSWHKVPATLTSLYSTLSDYASHPLAPPTDLVTMSNPGASAASLSS